MMLVSYHLGNQLSLTQGMSTLLWLGKDFAAFTVYLVKNKKTQNDGQN